MASRQPRRRNSFSPISTRMGARSAESSRIRRRRCLTATSAHRYSKRAATSASRPAATRSRERCSTACCRCQSRNWRQAADTSLEIIAPFLGDVVSIRKTLGCYRIHESNHGMLGDAISTRANCASRSSSICSANGRCASSRRSSGFTVPRNWAARDPAHLKYRLASLRVDPTHHPMMDDRPAAPDADGNPIDLAQSRLQFSRAGCFTRSGFRSPRFCRKPPRRR